MTGSKEIFEQQQQADFDPATAHQQQMQEEQHYSEMTGPMPVLDLNTLQPDERNIKLDKDTLNIKSSDIALPIIAAINEGFINPLEFAVKRKLVVDAFDMVMKDSTVKRIAIEEVQSYGKEKCTKLGAKLSIFTKPVYQYDKDPKWAEIKAQMAPLEEQLKAQEEKIKAACKNNASLVSEDGELIASIVPAPATESIAVSFSKR